MRRRPTVIPAADPTVIAELVDLRRELLADDDDPDQPAEQAAITRHQPGRTPLVRAGR